MTQPFARLAAEIAGQLKGKLYTDETTRRLYATDASAYRELPMAVVVPEHDEDIVTLVKFAAKNQISLIPRTAGTSLAGQVVGAGIVVDMSQHFNALLEINVDEKWAWVQPGIVRDDLNRAIKHTGLFFAPETSTANRAMIGGMIGNNSCGANSVVYGSTREHLLEVKTILADGTQTWFGPVSDDVFLARCNGMGVSGELHANLYFHTRALLDDPINQKEIVEGYPDPKIPRRNTGYALDMLLRQRPFSSDGKPFNFCELIAGSEGTLAIVTAAKVKLSPIPSSHQRLVCVHCNSIDESLRANLVALKFSPTASELMDHYILEATKRNSLYVHYRWFVEGDPAALLVVELTCDSEAEADKKASALVNALNSQGLGYAHPIISGEEIAKVWGLRKAGLGLLSNVPGDEKPVPVIEDTAVNVTQLPEYIAEFNEILKKHGLFSVHYAHAGSGELHLRPILDLKTAEGRRLFRVIAEEIAALVKKYKGSLSGEHGDGRLRGEFIPFMLGDHNYELCKQVKSLWDPQGIFNPGKIVNTPPMDTFLRFEQGQSTPNIETVFDFSDTHGLIRASEQCNGSGDCRKSAASGGTMCPSYMATKNEKDTTRARANILREILTKSTEFGPENFGNSPQIAEVMDLCLSCKGCKSECPSNVDIAKLKAEWLHHRYEKTGIPFRTSMIGNFTRLMKTASFVPSFYNTLTSNKLTSWPIKAVAGFAQKRSMPKLEKTTLTKWIKNQFKRTTPANAPSLYLFIDEFTNYNDVEAGKSAILLLDKLGFNVLFVDHEESGRTFLSKGMLKKAKAIAEKNVSIFSHIIYQTIPLVGIEPSAILTFRDEYPALLRGEMQEKAIGLSRNTFTFEEFLSKEIDAKRINKSLFSDQPKTIYVHGHCHQKALSSMVPTKKILSLPENWQVRMIPSGCCGMAGSFGYEADHYDLSMQIGELVLFPAIRKMSDDAVIVAAGTSCRHQIKDGVAKKAFHPAELLWSAIKK